MRLYLLRHAEAEETGTSDSTRRLTAKGEQQALAVGDFCRKHLPHFDLIVSSPVVRAASTAEIVQQQAKAETLTRDRRLSCGMKPTSAVELLRENAGANAVMLVGHQPDLSDLAAYFLSSDGSCQVDFGKASLLGLDLSMFRPGAGILKLYLPSRMLLLN